MPDDGATTTVPVPDQFAMRSAGTPAALAVADTRTAWNYGQLARAAAEVADRLVAAGLRPGEGAAVLLPVRQESLNPAEVVTEQG